MPSTLVTVATRSVTLLARSMPWRTARATYSGNSAALPAEAKNCSTWSEPGPLTLMWYRFSCRWKASSPSREVPR